MNFFTIGGKEPAWYSRTSLLITSVFSIFCFFPMGIVALYYGMKVGYNNVAMIDMIYVANIHVTKISSTTKICSL